MEEVGGWVEEVGGRVVGVGVEGRVGAEWRGGGMVGGGRDASGREPSRLVIPIYYAFQCLMIDATAIIFLSLSRH